VSTPANPFARLDLLIYNLCGRAVRQYLEPEMGPGLWDAGLNKVVAQQIARAGIPQQAITTIRIGNLDVPVEALKLIAHACGLLAEHGELNAGE
jgi:hypothetical protein